MARRFHALIPTGLILVCMCAAARGGAAHIAPVTPAADELPAPAPGMFLVAARAFLDPHFSQTVIYLLQHDRHASFGVIVNRPTAMKLSERVSGLEGTVLAPMTVYDGGPVNPEMPVTVVENPAWETRYDAGLVRHVADGIFASVNPLILDKLLQGKSRSFEQVRCYYGHVGWVPGQLERELGQHNWHLTKGSAEEVFGQDAAGLWQRLIERLEPVDFPPTPDPFRRE
jgi:putative transcriptional regulator